MSKLEAITAALDFVFLHTKSQSDYYDWRSYPNYNWVMKTNNIYYGSGWMSGCYGKMSNITTGMTVFINKFQSSANTLSPKVTEAFFDFVCGDESPFVEWKDELFPSEPNIIPYHHPITSEDIEVDINSREFRMKTAMLFPELKRTPPQVLVNFLKMLRMCIDKTGSVLLWHKLVEKGWNPRSAIAVAVFWNYNPDQKAISSMANMEGQYGWHTFTDGSFPVELIKNATNRTFEDKYFKSPYHAGKASSWSGTDHIWYSKQHGEYDTTYAWIRKLEKQITRIGRAYTDPFTGKQIISKSSNLEFDSFEEITRKEVESIINAKS